MLALTIIGTMLTLIFGYEAWAIWRRETAWRRAMKRRGKLVD
jgi:hypothetical protein